MGRQGPSLLASSPSFCLCELLRETRWRRHRTRRQLLLLLPSQDLAYRSTRRQEPGCQLCTKLKMQREWLQRQKRREESLRERRGKALERTQMSSSIEDPSLGAFKSRSSKKQVQSPRVSMAQCH